MLCRMFGLRSGRLLSPPKDGKQTNSLNHHPQTPPTVNSVPIINSQHLIANQDHNNPVLTASHFSPYFPLPTHQYDTFGGQSGRNPQVSDVEELVDFDAGYVISSQLSQLVANGAYSYPNQSDTHSHPSVYPSINTPSHSPVHPSFNTVHIKPDPDQAATCSYSQPQPVRIKTEPSLGPQHPTIHCSSLHHSTYPQSTADIKIKAEPGTSREQDSNCLSVLPNTTIKVKTEPSTVKKDPDSDEPPLWRVQYQNICQMRADRTAPVDTHGCFMLAERDVLPQVRRYQVLISLMLSSQTKDQITGKAMTNLKKHGLTVGNILATSREDIAKMIHAVGFWQKKSDYIKRTTDILADKYNSDIPDTLEGLMSLPGVGPKMSNLVMDFAWGKVTGIAVDTHVHRISHRLGWMTKQTPTPEATRIALEKWLPMSEWSNLNLMMVGFGQTLCSPQRPRCEDCLNRNICPSSTACSDATMGGLVGSFSPDALTTGKKKKKSRTPLSKMTTPIKGEPLPVEEPTKDPEVRDTTPTRKKRKMTKN